jgi:alginate O-acetyltransferase complex protein AlgI
MLGHIYAIIAFVYGWVIFRSESVLQIGQITKALVGGYGVNSDTLNIAALLQRCNVNTIFVITFILGVLVSTPIFSKISKTFEKYKAVGYIKDAGIILTLLLCVSQLAVNSYNPFIYFRF